MVHYLNKDPQISPILRQLILIHRTELYFFKFKDLSKSKAFYNIVLQSNILL